MSGARFPRRARAGRTRDNEGADQSSKRRPAPTRVGHPPGPGAIDTSNQALFDLALQAGRLVCWTYNPTSGLDWLGRELGRLHGLISGDVRPRSPFPSVHPADRTRLENIFRAATARNEHTEFEMRLVGGNGDERWISVCARSRLKPTGDWEFIGVSRDVTESVRSSQRLRRELSHRLRNVFPMILTIVKHTAARYPQAAEYRDALEQRLRALAAAAAFVDRDEADTVSIGDLVGSALAPFGEGDNIVITGPAVGLQAALMQDFTILVHELATNAVKHGALSSSQGRLSVSWRLTQDSDGQRGLTLEWIERDGPKVGPINSPGFGTMVIAESGSLLGGTASVEYAPEGLRYRLSLPAERLRTVVASDT